MIGVTFATPHESSSFLARLRWPGGSAGHINNSIIGNLGEKEVALCHTGIGAEPAREAVEILFQMHQPRVLVAAGFAGALAPDLRAGDVVVAENFSDPNLIQTARNVLGDGPWVNYGRMVTQPAVMETGAAKYELGVRTGAMAVDMETAAIHDACAQRHVPLLALRSISDGVSAAMPVPFDTWFDVERQKPRVLPLFAHLTRHPRSLKPFIRFLQDVQVARERLTHALLLVVPEL